MDGCAYHDYATMEAERGGGVGQLDCAVDGDGWGMDGHKRDTLKSRAARDCSRQVNFPHRVAALITAAVGRRVSCARSRRRRRERSLRSWRNSALLVQRAHAQRSPDVACSIGRNITHLIERPDEP